jgi:hypothetical protein
LEDRIFLMSASDLRWRPREKLWVRAGKGEGEGVRQGEEGGEVWARERKKEERRAGGF